MTPGKQKKVKCGSGGIFVPVDFLALPLRECPNSILVPILGRCGVPRGNTGANLGVHQVYFSAPLAPDLGAAGAVTGRGRGELLVSSLLILQGTGCSGAGPQPSQLWAILGRDWGAGGCRVPGSDMNLLPQAETQAYRAGRGGQPGSSIVRVFAYSLAECLFSPSPPPLFALSLALFPVMWLKF